MTATDQYGDALDLYDLIKEQTAVTTVNFEDLNHLTKGTTKITLSGTNPGSITVKKDSSKKTVKFTYNPDSSIDKTTSVIATVQTATPTASALTWTVNAEPTLAGIKSYDGDTTVKKGTKIADTANVQKYTMLDTTGGTSTKKADYVEDDATIQGYAKTSGATYGYYIGIKSSDTKAFSVNSDGSITAGTDSNHYSSTITATLYKVAAAPAGASSTNDVVTPLKSITFTANIAGAAKSYTATLHKGDELLYVNKDSKDSAAFDVKAVDENSVAIAFDDYTVTVDSDLAVKGQEILGVPKKTVSAAGTAVATIWVDGKAEVTVDVPYDVAAPVAQKTDVSKYDAATEATAAYAKDTVDDVAAYQQGDGVVALTDSSSNVYYFMILDQYG